MLNTSPSRYGSGSKRPIHNSNVQTAVAIRQTTLRCIARSRSCNPNSGIDLISRYDVRLMDDLVTETRLMRSHSHAGPTSVEVAALWPVAAPTTPIEGNRRDILWVDDFKA
jgi:hypothetical protein